MSEIRDRLEARHPAPAPNARMLQTARSDGAAPSGTPGQTDAVAGLLPTAGAAASLAAAGTDSGSRTIATITFNPAILFGGSDPATVAKWSRIADLSFLVPLEREEGDPAAALGLRYLGIRGRINLTGLGEGNALVERMAKAFRAVLAEEDALVRAIESGLLGLPSEAAIEVCAQALLEAEVGSAPAQCKGSITVDWSEQTYQSLLDGMAAVRDSADSRYFGLDLRADLGDPTLSASAENDVRAFSLGLAYGKRFLRPGVRDAMGAVRLWLSARYAEPQQVANSVLWGAEGGAALELSRLLVSDQYLRFSGGLDFRYSSSHEAVREVVQPNHVSLRLGLTVPVAGGTSLSLGLSAPVSGKLSPALTANFNWGMLLGSLASLTQPATRR